MSNESFERGRDEISREELRRMAETEWEREERQRKALAQRRADVAARVGKYERDVAEWRNRCSTTLVRKNKADRSLIRMQKDLRTTVRSAQLGMLATVLSLGTSAFGFYCVATVNWGFVWLGAVFAILAVVLIVTVVQDTPTSIRHFRQQVQAAEDEQEEAATVHYRLVLEGEPVKPDTKEIDA